MIDPDAKKYVDDGLALVASFKTKKVGDTPTDDFQLVPKKYVDTQVAPRVISIITSPSYAINTDSYNVLSITALATGITIDTTGTYSNFQKLIVRIKDNGSPQTITWSAKFLSYGVVLPTTTVASKVLTVGFLYDSVAVLWGCVASVQQ